jgi:pimeloyl-ACP methyl ester carboxylesterase
VSNTKKVVVLGAATLGIGAAAVGAYRATHPKEARGLPTDHGGRRPHVDDALLELPASVIHHHLPTPDGGSIHAIEAGTGRPLVLLHGITLRSDVWAPQFHQLADRYRVIAVDLRGHGESTAGTAGYGIPRLAEDLATLLDSLDLHDAVVVGHSMGGMTVMRFCGDHPEVLARRVAGLVFVATRAHQVMPPYVDRLARVLVAQGQARLDSGHDLPARAHATDPIVRLAFGDQPSRAAVRIVGQMGASMKPEALVPSLRGLLDHDARDALRITHTPSLVVVGTRDLLTPVPSARHLAHLLPDSDFVVLPKAGHQLMQERPDELAELVDAFVAKLEGSAPSVAAAVDADPGPVEASQVEHSP